MSTPKDAGITPEGVQRAAQILRRPGSPLAGLSQEQAVRRVAQAAEKEDQRARNGNR